MLDLADEALIEYGDRETWKDIANGTYNVVQVVDELWTSDSAPSFEDPFYDGLQTGAYAWFVPRIRCFHRRESKCV